MLCVALHQYYSTRNNPSSQEEISSKMPGVLENALNAGKTAGKKAKMRAELVLLDRKIPARKKAFGIELYDKLNAMTCNQDFYSTNDQTISTLRPHLLATDREIRALSNKKLEAKGSLDIAVARRAEAFPAKASNWKEKAANAATATGMMGNETKIKTRMALVQSQMNIIKEKFGMQVYDVLEELFGVLGTEQIPEHSATDKDVNAVKAVFRQCKGDIEEILRTKKEKLEQIDALNVDMSLRRL